MNLKIIEGVWHEPVVTAKQFQEMHDMMVAEVSRLKEALKFYADKNKWDTTMQGVHKTVSRLPEYETEIERDGGKVARQVLEIRNERA